MDSGGEVLRVELWSAIWFGEKVEHDKISLPGTPIAHPKPMSYPIVAP